MKRASTGKRAERKNIIWGFVLGTVVVFALGLIVVNVQTPEKQADRHVDRLYSIEDPQFKRSLGILLGPPLIGSNRVQTLRNGDEIFPSMLEAIRGAKETIDFETYVYWTGDIGHQFADALAERARAGVRTQVMLDWFGSQKMDKDALATLRAGGVAVEYYHPLSWYQLDRMNNRTHRKILVVDGKIAYTGGVGVAEEWTGRAQDPDHWRDTHFRIEGPVVSQMQSIFMDNWIKVTGSVEHGEKDFPEVAPVGNMQAQAFSSSPAGGGESMELMYILALTAAKKSIYFEASYFIPSDLAMTALIEARKRGVEVSVIVPGEHNDAKLTRYASRAKWEPLLAAGVRIYEYEPTMFHCKVLVVDGLLSSIGSTNFDARSFRLNDEANLNVLDATFAAEQERVFADDLAHSQEIHYADWRDRGWYERLREHISTLLEGQL